MSRMFYYLRNATILMVLFIIGWFISLMPPEDLFGGKQTFLYKLVAILIPGLMAAIGLLIKYRKPPEKVSFTVSPLVIDIYTGLRRQQLRKHDISAIELLVNEVVRPLRKSIFTFEFTTVTINFFLNNQLIISEIIPPANALVLVKDLEKFSYPLPHFDLGRLRGITKDCGMEIFFKKLGLAGVAFLLGATTLLAITNIIARIINSPNSVF